MKVDIAADFRHFYLFECYDKHGKLKWREIVRNLVTTEGGNDILTQYYKGSAYTAAHYLGLTGGSPTFALADTLASHAGWTEATPYSGNRPTLTGNWGTAASKSLATSAAISIAITATATVGGGFIATAASGTAGTLVGGGAFSADRSVASGDTLNVTPTASV